VYRPVAGEVYRPVAEAGHVYQPVEGLMVV